jgi:hypothetical protein
MPSRAQFGKDHGVPAVYDMLSRMKQARRSRAILYQTFPERRHLQNPRDISHDEKLTPGAHREKLHPLGHAFTPLSKGMAWSMHQNATTASSARWLGLHHGNKCQRLYRDARIFSIYEGTTQLQVVLPFVTSPTADLNIISDAPEEVSGDEPLQEHGQVSGTYEEAVER